MSSASDSSSLYSWYYPSLYSSSNRSASSESSSEYNSSLRTEFGCWDPYNTHLHFCTYEVEDGIVYALYVALFISFFVTSATLLLIPCRRQLRKQHFIIPFNIVLADSVLTGILTSYHMSYCPTCNEWPSLPALKNFLEAVDFAQWTCTTVSSLSILLVAIYQYISIHLDPFGSRNLLTTPRCICACALTWGMAAGTTQVLREASYKFGFLSVCLPATLITGICYVLIYRAISRNHGNGDKVRQVQNRRVMRTYGLVFLTNLVVIIFTGILNVLSHAYEYSCSENSECYSVLRDLTLVLNVLANDVIYWWRLKEFRAMISPRCRKDRVVPLIHVT